VNLFQVNQSIQNILDDHLDTETGEISDEGIEFLLLIEGARDKLALELAAEVNNHVTAAAGIKESVKRLKARQDQHTGRVASITKLLNKFVPEGTVLESSEAKIHWRKSTGVIIDDATLLEEECFVTKRAVNLTEVKRRLQSGDIYEKAAHLEKRNTLKVS
jgi:hypothetical protein